jgi:hypothetical protein
LRKKLLKQLNCDFLFFCPTRHDWVEGAGFNDKANEIFIMALADMRRKGLKVGAIFCEWGGNVKESKEMINIQGLLPHVHWVRPLAMVPFARMAKASDIVVDQFKIGSFGGVMFKSMAIGLPVLTYINKVKILEQYAEPPPVINCSSRNDIVREITALYENREKLREISILSMKWISKFHSKKNTVNKQVDQFRHFHQKLLG